MFNIGLGELLIVLVVAFVIVGPDDLPRVARWLGRQVRRLRTLIRDIKATFGVKTCLLSDISDYFSKHRDEIPILAELEEEYPEVKFCKINVDNDPELAKAFNVTSIPMVAFVNDNTFVDLSVGFVPKATLKKLVEDNK